MAVDCGAVDTAKFGFRLTGASSDVTFWRTRFSDFAESTGSDNQSCIMACNGGDGKRWAILDCAFTRIHHGYGIIGYTVEKLLVGRCSFTEMDGASSLPFGPKVDCQRWVVRENRFAHNAKQNIWLYYAQHEQSGNPYGEMEVAYNVIEAGDGQDALALTINQSAHAVELPSYIYRNTIIGPIQLFHYKPEYAAMFFRDNVLVSQPRKPDGQNAVVDSIGIAGPASAVEAAGNLHFPSREGNLTADGSLVQPVPGKGHRISP